MKKTIYLATFVVFMLGCSINKQPVFLKVDNVKVVSVTSDTIRLKAAAFFNNPNDVGGKISTDEIKVILNGTEVAQVSSDEFRVPSKKEFSIPLKVVIPAKRVFENNKNGFLGGLLNSIINKSIKVQFKGNLKYKFLTFTRDFVVDHTKEIRL